ncbi:DUF2934 domain-containing protein [Chthonobacter rhizosphaerae]|uniref:DUF2934 domain-containing protein n=1 Tax=Chthonobacter rhizosphaerae TaxID=2735553 RepID=UPI0015EE9796|nr:DUF2934 domain-containing protein [Chthonobacter rhizosphaerae]
MVDDTERRVREKAYELWVAEGRPEGRSEAHWTEAREIIALQDANDTTLVPLDETLEDPVEPLISIENQGEFPEIRDQGDAPAGPSTEAAADAGRTDQLVVEDAPKRKRRSRTVGVEGTTEAPPEKPKGRRKAASAGA